MSTTHLAGPLVTFGKEDRVIQRCVVCGAKLEDYHPSLVAVVRTPGAPPSGVPSFAPGHMIRQHEDEHCTRSHSLGAFADCKELPEDFCLCLVE